MISEIRIRNFKSIHDLTLKPGRVTVLIGENGSGKSNILEGIGFAAAAAANKLDGEFLFNRGIRVTEPKWMMSAFTSGRTTAGRMDFSIRDEELGDQVEYRAVGGFPGDPTWILENVASDRDRSIAVNELSEHERNEIFQRSVKSVFATDEEATAAMKDMDKAALAIAFAENVVRHSRGKSFNLSTGLSDFLIYAPENTILRTPPPEGAIQPVGTKGEGLFRLLQTFADPKNAERLADLKERLRLFGWFEDFLVPDESATAQARIQIRDKWLAPERAIFDQRSANEGFLYLLFYFTVIMSARTPRFFAFDNVDNALNPKLCSTLMKQITELAKKYGKQVICTTHNAAILDGLDLEDDDVRLFTVRRDSEGHTALHRVKAPKPQPGETPVRLSEAFMRGILGGLPDHF